MAKYKLINEDTMKNLIEFLDEVQFDAATDGSTEDMHKVNFCNWAINELINSPEAHIKDLKNSKPKKPKKKSRDDYVDETFMDWNLPDMSDEDYEKLVDTFDAFLRGWEEEYYKNNPKKKPEQERPFKPHLEDVAEYMSLEDIKEMLLDDPELSDHERFELYYEEHLRVQKEKKKAKDMLRKEYNKFKKERKKQLKKK